MIVFDIETLIPLVRRAGDEVMRIYAQAFAVHGKADRSPVTEADWRAEAIIVQGLHALAPALPIVAEEAVAAGEVPAIGERFWLVDALDGTREFVARNGEFTVNLALVERGQPVLGLVFAPALEVLYGGAAGQGAFVERQGRRQPIRCREAPAEGLTVVASRSHGDAATIDAFLSTYKVGARRAIGSSLKFGLLAEGEADLYPRLSRTMEWDIAAGHAVLAAAGGQVHTLDGMPLRYGKPSFENPSFVATGIPAKAA